MAFETSKVDETTERPSDHPLLLLPREDLDLITELVLRSGSLKDLAAAYGVSYPTIRGRLDRVIHRLELAIQGRRPDPLTELLAALVERGELSSSGARAIKSLMAETKDAAADGSRPQKERGAADAPERGGVA